MAATSKACEEIREVLDARDATDLFGANEKSARIRYRRLVRAIHPDANGGSAESVEATKRLNRLWEEFEAAHGNRGDRGVATRHAGDAGRRPVELTRNASYALFREDDGWLVVRRKPGIGGGKPADGVGDKLLDVLDGSPVTMPSRLSAKAITQPDGPHEAFATDMPRGVAEGEHVLSLDELGRWLPAGTLHPADLAWIAKRVIFLAAALAKAGLAPADGASVPDMLAVDPEGHMLVLMAAWDVTDGDGSVASQRALTTPVLDRLAGMAGDDAKSRHVMRFFQGIGYDRVTESSDLLEEFDELLYEEFGGQVFHVMEIEEPRG